jgi:hypothetical protein
LNAPQKGKYGFFVLSTDHGKLWIDGRLILETPGSGQVSVELSKGGHRIELSDERRERGEIRADFHLLWMPPGQAQFRMVPITAFGKIPHN